jgi:dopamine beta-monooxygenase
MARLLFVTLLVDGSSAFPSFRDRVPNGRRVPCPEGVPGCDDGNELDCQPKKVCNGVGHANCAGGSLPLNPFGEDLQKHNYTWSKELCEADSDGDGLTNGQELGDPCCLWKKNDIPSKYTQMHRPTHPGFKDDSSVLSAYAKPDCSVASPKVKGVVLGEFQNNETQLSFEVYIDRYPIPKYKTTYVDIALNLPVDAFVDPKGVFHIVRAETIIDKKAHLHHYVLYGCSERWAENMHGKPLDRNSRDSCGQMWGGWAPGSSIFEMPPWAGEAFGPSAGIVALRVQVHYDNPLRVEGVEDSSGMKFFYTTTPRKHVVTYVRPMTVSVNEAIVLPPGHKRWFFTRTCEAEIVKKGTDEPAELRVLAVSYHAHLLGREMYTELQQKDGSTAPMSLGSEPKWHFDDQGWTNVYNAGVLIKTGDVIQSTCVMDTRSRTKATLMGQETTDEMCWARVLGWNPDGHEVQARCKGHMWSGELLDMEIPFRPRQAPSLHSCIQRVGWQ